MIKRNLPLMITIGVFVLGYIYCLTQFPGFASTRVICNILTDNAFLGIIAVGMTFVILSGGIDLSVGSVIALAHRTRFGNQVYAIGGNATSANLMGISTRSTTIRIYMLSTGLATLAGIVFSIYTQAGYALAGVGVELDAIASVVIGGTLLSGGVGTVLGTLFGVAIQGLIQTYINFDGTLSSWWTKIAIGILLFIFIALQRGLTVLWENRQSSPVTRVNIAQR